MKVDYSVEDEGAIIYNVTIKVEEAISKDWLKWLMNEHIPEVMATGCFTTYKVVRLLEIDDSEGPTYAVQYNALSKGIYNQYIDQFATELREKSFAKWGNRFMAFRSVMKVVQ